MNRSKRVLVVLFAYLGITLTVLLSSGGLSNHSLQTYSENHPSDAIAGKQLWHKKGCTVCHSVYGLGGHLGPDLTNVMDRRDGVYVEHIIKTGFAKMPAYPLKKPEIEALVCYFEYLNQLGIYPLQDPMNQSFGSNR